MQTSAKQSSIKMIGANGQISIGKQFAGRQVLVEEQEPGVWLVRTATITPDNEHWLHSPQAASELSRALDWAKTNAPSDATTEIIMEKLSKKNDQD
jgi:hypothetical protein